MAKDPIEAAHERIAEQLQYERKVLKEARSAKRIAMAKDRVIEAAMKRYRPHPSCDNARLETDLYHACAELSQAQEEENYG